VDEAETCIHVRPRFAGDKIFRPVTDQTEVMQCWYALTLYLYSLMLGLIVSSCLVVWNICPLDTVHMTRSTQRCRAVTYTSQTWRRLHVTAGYCNDQHQTHRHFCSR